MFHLLSWTYSFILILGRFKVEVYSSANFQIVEPIASIKQCKCQWKDDTWDFVNLGQGILEEFLYNSEFRIPVKKQLTFFIIEIVLFIFWNSRKSTFKLEMINLFTKYPCPFLFQIFCGAD